MKRPSSGSNVCFEDRAATILHFLAIANYTVVVASSFGLIRIDAAIFFIAAFISAVFVVCTIFVSMHPSSLGVVRSLFRSTSNDGRFMAPPDSLE